MKHTLALLFFFAASGAQALIISPREELEILSSIDSLCGDTWCEGDFDFEFKALGCSSGINSVCRLNFDMISTNSLAEIPSAGPNVTPAIHIRNSVSCEFTGIQSLSQIVENKNTWRLQESFYDSLSLCINALQEALQRK